LKELQRSSPKRKPNNKKEKLRRDFELQVEGVLMQRKLQTFHSKSEENSIQLT